LPLGADSNQYKKLVTTAAKFFGGGHLADPEAPTRIVKKAKSFAKGTAGKKRKKSRKSKK
jgi:hypothetical protein